MGEKIAEILKNLEIALGELTKRQKITDEDYKKSRELQDIIEREFERAIQDCIDIGARIIATEGFEAADTYGEIFKILENNGVIDYELCDGMRELAGFRNVLVHIYRQIDHEEVLRHLKESLPAIRKFAKKTAEYVGLI